MVSCKIIAALLAIGRPSEPKPTTISKQLTTYEVCLSPGCVADGAQETLEKLQALAPPNVIVKAGSCSSFCGSGPVVLGSGETTSKHRKVSGKKVLELLFPDAGDMRPSVELVGGYELVLQADQVFSKKDYATAVQLYEQALALAFRPAMVLQTARDQMQRDYIDESSTTAIAVTKQPIGLQWLIRARCNEASAKLELGDVDGALFAAQGACNLSRNTNAASFQVLSHVYQRKKDTAGELQALQTMFALPVSDESKLSFSEQNRRREFGFRLQKLEREKKQQVS
jgi:hypothetical protein